MPLDERWAEFVVLKNIYGLLLSCHDEVISTPAIVVALAIAHLMQLALYAGDVVLGAIHLDKSLKLDSLLGEIAQRKVGSGVDTIDTYRTGIGTVRAGVLPLEKEEF